MVPARAAFFVLALVSGAGSMDESPDPEKLSIVVVGAPD